MENNKLRVLLSKSADPSESEAMSEDAFVSINRSMALKLKATYGGFANNNACSSNSGCSNNNNCSGNNSCSGNDNCHNY